MRIDINADLGEGFGRYICGDDDALLAIVTSANVACGFHAGDPEIMAHTYTVAIGMAGLETPAGLYHIQDKQVNPSWHVPNSAWAGKLAGKVIPPGPDNPIQARWMGIYAGAGIHGTDDAGSIGSAASHGCIRMRIPDVEELYDQVPVNAPVYIS